MLAAGSSDGPARPTSKLCKGLSDKASFGCCCCSSAKTAALVRTGVPDVDPPDVRTGMGEDDPNKAPPTLSRGSNSRFNVTENSNSTTPSKTSLRLKDLTAASPTSAASTSRGTAARPRGLEPAARHKTSDKLFSSKALFLG